MFFKIYFVILFNRTRPHLHVHDEVQERKQDVAMAEENDEFAFLSAVRGFHVYRRVWVPHVGQRLSGEREDGKMEGRFAVAVVQHRLGNDEDSNARTTARHLPRELSQIVWYFLLHGGEIDCEVTGRKQRSPLVQGGLEIPCCVTLRGKKKLVAEAKEVLEKKTKLYNRK